MDAKITKTRLKTMLSYDWLKIVGAIAAAIFVWVMAFTMTATKIVSSQKFGVCSYMGNVPVGTVLGNNLEKNVGLHLQNGKFTHETLEVEVVDLASAQDAANSLLQSRVYVNEFDVMFISTENDVNTAYQAEGSEDVLYERTYLESFLYGYYNKLHYVSRTDEKGYFKKLEGYLNRYYTNGYLDESVLDTDKIEEDFRARAKGDKRYKTEKEIRKGVEGDIARVKTYRAALVAFDGYLADGTVKITNSSLTDRNGEEVFKDGKGEYSINICPNEEGSKQLSKYVAYQTTYTDESGKTQKKTTAKDMQICLFNTNERDVHAFEGLVYLTNFLADVFA